MTRAAGILQSTFGKLLTRHADSLVSVGPRGNDGRRPHPADVLALAEAQREPVEQFDNAVMSTGAST